MAMSVGGTKKAMSDINITPLIDVVLVLLIIFMVITPIILRSITAELPQPSQSQSSGKVEKQVILAVNDEGNITLDNEPVTIESLPGKIHQLFPASKSDKTIMFSAGKKVKVDEVVNLMDICKGNGVQVIGIR
jgi:biopolymer transport protein TolR